jgi:nucleotide-binding universal stress UspA family protein
MEFKKVLVPVKGIKADEEAVKLACMLTRRTKGKVYVIYIIEVERSLPLDIEIESETEKGERILNRAESIAEDQNYKIETEILQAREAGPAVIEEAIERDVDLILIGLGYKKRFGEFSLGTTVPYILKNAPCQVLIYRKPILEES